MDTTVTCCLKNGRVQQLKSEKSIGQVLLDQKHRLDVMDGDPDVDDARLCVDFDIGGSGHQLASNADARLAQQNVKVARQGGRSLVRAARRPGGSCPTGSGARALGSQVLLAAFDIFADVGTAWGSLGVRHRQRANEGSALVRPRDGAVGEGRLRQHRRQRASEVLPPRRLRREPANVRPLVVGRNAIQDPFMDVNSSLT